MKTELAREEAEILIAVLTFAEGAAAILEPAMVEALNALRPWRSTLLRDYLRAGIAPSEAPSQEPNR